MYNQGRLLSDAGAGAGAGSTAHGSTNSPDSDRPDAATSEQIVQMLATQDVLLDYVSGIKEHQRTLQRGIEHDRPRSSEGSAAPSTQAVVEQSAIQKLLGHYTKELSHKLQDLHYYIRPDVLTELPGNLTVGEYVAEVEARKREDTSRELLAEVDDYLASGDNVLLLLGEPGAGKSLFAWHCTQARLAQYQQVLDGENPGVTLSLPVVIDLKNYTLNELFDLLPRYLKNTCKLKDEELSAIQHDRKPQHKLLVVLDGFDELKQPAAGERDIYEFFGDCFTVCGAKDWYAGQIKLVVTCRVRHLQNRILERQYFAHGEGGHYRRRILLPFSSTKIAAYLQERARRNGSREESAEVADYLEVLDRSKSVKEMVRNPFVLRLFAEALPKLKMDGVPLNRISRFVIYQKFVSQWFERNVNKLDEATKLAIGIGTHSKSAESFAHYAAILANEMYRRNSLVVGLSEVKSEHVAFKVWFGLETQLLEEIASQSEVILAKRFRGMGAFERRRLEREGIIDESMYIEKHLEETCELEELRAESGLLAFKKTSPLRQSGEYYSFIHKSFYEYFIAAGIIQTAASDNAQDKRVADTLAMLGGRPEYDSRRLRQEPGALDFVCEYWAKANPAEKDRLSETWFGVIEATKGHPEHGVAGANAGTLLNWVNVSCTEKDWKGVHLPGVDFRQAYLERSNLQKANLSGAWLEKIQAKNVDLSGAVLTGVEFSERPAIPLANPYVAIAYHPIEPIVAVADGNLVRQYNFAKSIWLKILEEHIDIVISVNYSPDGYWLTSVSKDKTICHWRTETGELRWKALKGYDYQVNSASISRNGLWLACGSEEMAIRLWDAKSCEVHWKLLGHEGVVTSVSFSPDELWLASGSEDKTVRLWNVEDGKEYLRFEGHNDSVSCISFCPDGNWLASADLQGKLLQWNTKTGEERGVPVSSPGLSIRSVSYSPDGRWLASAAGTAVQQWEADSGKVRGEFLLGHTEAVVCVCYSPDGKWLVSGSKDKTIRSWKAGNGEARRPPSISYSLDERWLASVRINAIWQWDVKPGEASETKLPDRNSGGDSDLTETANDGTAVDLKLNLGKIALEWPGFSHTSKKGGGNAPKGSATGNFRICNEIYEIAYNKEGNIKVWKRIRSTSSSQTDTPYAEPEARAGTSTTTTDDSSAENEARQLSWTTKNLSMQLSCHRLKLSGAEGLKPHQLELLRQHGYQGSIDAESGKVKDTLSEEHSPESEDDVEYCPAAVEEAKEEDAGHGAANLLTYEGFFAHGESSDDTSVDVPSDEPTTNVGDRDFSGSMEAPHT